MFGSSTGYRSQQSCQDHCYVYQSHSYGHTPLVCIIIINSILQVCTNAVKIARFNVAPEQATAHRRSCNTVETLPDFIQLSRYGKKFMNQRYMIASLIIIFMISS